MEQSLAVRDVGAGFIAPACPTTVSRAMAHRSAERQGLPTPMAARLRSRLRIGNGKGVREQGTEPETLVTGQVSGLLLRHRPERKPAGFHLFGWAAGLAVRHGPKDLAPHGWSARFNELPSPQRKSIKLLYQWRTTLACSSHHLTAKSRDRPASQFPGFWASRIKSPVSTDGHKLLSFQNRPLPLQVIGLRPANSLTSHSSRSRVKLCRW